MKVLVYPHDLEMGGSQTNAIEIAAKIRDLGQTPSSSGAQESFRLVYPSSTSSSSSHPTQVDALHGELPGYSDSLLASSASTCFMATSGRPLWSAWPQPGGHRPSEPCRR